VLVLFTLFALSYGRSQAQPPACDDEGGCCKAPKIGPVIPFINFNVNPTYGVEGIAISPDNDIYIGSVYEGEIHKVEQNGQATLFAKLVTQPNDGYLLGLVVAKDETVYAAVWGCNAPINGVWHIDKNGRSRLAMPIPGAFCASIPNNLVYDEDGNLYATDSGYGSVWRLGRYGDIRQWVQDPLLKPVTAFGANGAAYRNHSLWIVNSDQGSIVQIPINGDGSAGLLADGWR
jgi:sugar lactone lactonase YvrE